MYFVCAIGHGWSVLPIMEKRQVDYIHLKLVLKFNFVVHHQDHSHCTKT